MAMRAGTLRHRVVIQSNTPAVNEFGERIDAWGVFNTVWAAVEPIAGNERWLQQIDGEVASATTRIRIRYLEGITTAMKVTHRGNVYDIEAPLNRWTRDREIWLMCKESAGTLGPDGVIDGTC